MDRLGCCCFSLSENPLSPPPNQKHRLTASNLFLTRIKVEAGCETRRRSVENILEKDKMRLSILRDILRIESSVLFHEDVCVQSAVTSHTRGTCC